MNELGFGTPLDDGTKRLTNCTTGGPVFVYVKNNRILRITPIIFDPNDSDSWVIEAKAKRFTPPRKALVSPWTLSERSRIQSPDRILYPLKRKDFNLKKDRYPENRGKSEYERISWEEALDLVAGEIKRVKGKYGPAAIAATTSSHHNWGNIGYRHSTFFRFWNLNGFTYVDHNPDSWEGWHWGAMHTWGFHWRLGVSEQYDLLEDAMKHSEMIVFWSSDPEATSGVYAGQESAVRRLWLKRDLNLKMIFIDPYCNDTAALFADKWLAPRPGTDAAIALAISYVWLTEGTYEKEYVATHTYGFDQWVDYVLGKEDGTRKDPQWAEQIAGIPARDIRALAREWASKRTMLAAGGLGGWGGACRSAYATEWARMMVLLQAMQGLGKPGVNIWSTTGGSPYNASFYFPGYAEGGISGDPNRTAALRHLVPRGIVNRVTMSRVHQHLPRLKLPDCIMNPPQEWRGEGFCGMSIERQLQRFRYPNPEYPEVKMFFRYGGSYIGTMTETNRWVRMYRSPKLEFVVNQNMFLDPETRFADLILPACTNFERWDIGEWASSSGYIPHGSCNCNHRVIVLQMKCIEPLGESKPDYDIFAMIARRLGFEEEFTENNTDLNWVRRMFEVSDLPKHVTWDEFKRKGYFIVPLPKPYKPTPALRWFYEHRPRDTPDWGPDSDETQTNKLGLATPSGKIEFVSQSLARFDPNDQERPPMPRYIDSWEGHTSELAKNYPLQLISPHPRYSFHTMYDGKGTWVNEVPEHRLKKQDGRRYWVIRVNPIDAKQRGISDSDQVRVFNNRGAVVCVARVTERVRPGTVHSYESCSVYEPEGEPGSAESVDLGGCVNLLTPSRFISKNACGMAPNSCLVELEKWM